jgi:membrane protein DedA with SNARE-associated domain
LEHWGYAAVFLLVYIECLGVPLPGETILVAAGLYAGTTHHLEIVLVWAVAAAAGTLGGITGFGIGHYGGFALLRRWGRYIRLDQPKLKVGRYLFTKHGGKVVFFGRFVSILRTYAAFLAGSSRMPWKSFMIFNAAGALAWSALYAFGSNALGSASKANRLGNVINFVLIGVIVVVLVGAVLYLRRKGAALIAKAEAEFPGDLSEYG